MRKNYRFFQFDLIIIILCMLSLIAGSTIVKGQDGDFVSYLPLILKEKPALQPIKEIEPNNTTDTAQFLSSIGYRFYVEASINEPGDVDWYRFKAVAGRSYTVELFDVALGLAASGSECHGYTEDGVGIRIYDPTGHEITNASYSCDAWGMGNVHNIESFTANLSGYYHILVHPNNKDVEGDYSIRVLPKYGEPGAGWDTMTFEPNNSRFTAYKIALGMSGALTSTIESRDPLYSTFTVDEDYYRFEAVAGRSYTVELFNVALGLAASGSECHGYTEDGVGIRIYDPTGHEITKASYSCDAWGMGNVHNIESFTVNLSGYYHILVHPNNKDVEGDYSIRVLPKYGEPGADWDAGTFEPNNSRFNAYKIELGASQALTSTIEPRGPTYSTFTVDEDYYRFEAVAGRLYEVELFDVASELNASGSECHGYTEDGVGIRIYDPTGHEITNASYSCDALFEETVHNSWSFDAHNSGIYSIQIHPNNKDAYGIYKIRTCENECP